ncbi:MAG: sugar O-acetyltransferase [Lachnospiraceae bacterium]|nr:sugar O-acetyltransferase [Lachnospiraceae bacterium]
MGKKNKKQWDRMMAGKLYQPLLVGDDSWDRIHDACYAFNQSAFGHNEKEFTELRENLGTAPDDLIIIPPFYCDHGDRIHFGKHCFANTDLTILDENDVRIGDNVFLAPHVSIYTAGHPIAPDIRNLDLEYALPVTIGDNVWIGGNVVINPGVTIGSNTVIGSGSVVTRDIPDWVIAAGNPCKVIREITEEEKDLWKQKYQEYKEECGED